MRFRLCTYLLALLVGLMATTVDSAASDVLLGEDGVVYTLTAGTYGELFPGGTATAADNSVLSLRIDRGDDGVSALLVPGTEEMDRETSESLVLEASTGTVYLLWQSWQNPLHSRLYLSGLTSTGWLDEIELVRRPFAIIRSPRLAVTRDSYVIEEAGQLVAHQRTILHLVWVEEGSDRYRVIYAPLILIDGHLMFQETVDLTSLVPAPEQAPALLQSDVLAALTLRPGLDGHSIVAGFADDATGQIVGMELQVVPGEVTALGDSLAQFLDDEFEQTPAPDEHALQAIADRSRGHIIDIGAHIHPALINHLAQETHGYISSQPPGLDVASIIEGSRGHIIDIGASFDRPGIRKITGGSRGHIIDIGASADGTPTASDLADHQVRASVTLTHDAPETGTAPEFFITADGSQILVAWMSEGGSKLLYRETRESGWSAVNSLAIDDELAVTDAHRLLERRINER